MSASKTRGTESSIGTAGEPSGFSTEDLLVCKKTGKTMTWDEAFCPNKGKTCGYRGDCQILVLLAEKKDEGD